MERAQERLTGQAARRWAVRRAAALLSATCAVIYFAIGLGVVKAFEPTPAAGDVAVFGISAGLAFLVGAALLLAVDRYRPFIAGAVLQVIVIAMYFAVADARTPPFEAWGVFLKLAQAGILVALLWLIVSPGGRCPCAYCEHHRRLHRGRCMVPTCRCEAFL